MQCHWNTEIKHQLSSFFSFNWLTVSIFFKWCKEADRLTKINLQTNTVYNVCIQFFKKKNERTPTIESLDENTDFMVQINCFNYIFLIFRHKISRWNLIKRLFSCHFKSTFFIFKKMQYYDPGIDVNSITATIPNSDLCPQIGVGLPFFEWVFF